MLVQLSTATSDPWVEIVALCFGVVTGCSFTYFGYSIVKDPEPVARFFASWGSRAFGSRIARRTYTAANFRVAGLWSVIFSPLFVVGCLLLIWHRVTLVFSGG